LLQFYLIISVTLAFDAVLLGGLAWAFHSPRFAEQRISDDLSIKVSRGARLLNMLVSSTLSLITVIGVTYVFYEQMVHGHGASPWRIALEALAILVIYDFSYYLLHRAMHIKKVMRWVHGVHHRAKNPSALESFYLHPAELLAGLMLLMVSALLVGPVHIYAFAIAFFVHSTLNIVIHSGLSFGHTLLRPIDYLTEKHHVHHNKDFAKNYASLTPLPDLLFGTAG
jgi:sterol desaturase/sphingolipid hydroxylase (fatty acid hydroxylase superfamily)